MCGEYINGTVPCSSFVGISSSERLIVVFVIISLCEGVVRVEGGEKKKGLFPENVSYLDSIVRLFGRGGA